MKAEKKTANQGQLLDTQIGAYIMQNTMVLEEGGGVVDESCILKGVICFPQ